MLANCPRCQYSLTGLPTDHACPECGLRYDAQCQVYVRRQPWRVFFMLLAIIFGVIPMLNILRDWANMPAVGRMLLITMLILQSTSLAWLTLYYWRLHRSGSKVAITGDGLILRLDHHRNEMIPWSDISRCVVSRATRGAVLFINSRRMTRPVTGVFETTEQVRQFVSEVNRRCGANG